MVLGSPPCVTNEIMEKHNPEVFSQGGFPMVWENHIHILALHLLSFHVFLIIPLSTYLWSNMRNYCGTARKPWKNPTNLNWHCEEAMRKTNCGKPPCEKTHRLRDKAVKQKAVTRRQSSCSASAVWMFSKTSNILECRCECACSMACPLLCAQKFPGVNCHLQLEGPSSRWFKYFSTWSPGKPISVDNTNLDRAMFIIRQLDGFMKKLPAYGKQKKNREV